MAYLTKIFAPKWSYSFIENKSGIATIEKLEKLSSEDKQVITYSYYNEYLGKEIKNTRTFSNHHYFDKFKEGETKQIQYAKYFSNFVKFQDIDSPPLAGLALCLYLFLLFGVFAIVGVLFDKVSLAMLAGVRNKEENEE